MSFKLFFPLSYQNRTLQHILTVFSTSRFEQEKVRFQATGSKKGGAVVYILCPP